jgi:hypothetical protein
VDAGTVRVARALEVRADRFEIDITALSSVVANTVVAALHRGVQRPITLSQNAVVKQIDFVGQPSPVLRTDVRRAFAQSSAGARIASTRTRPASA